MCFQKWLKAIIILTLSFYCSNTLQAAQDDENPGVLILSPFAGAGGLMHEALMANPYETLNVATAVNR